MTRNDYCNKMEKRNINGQFRGMRQDENDVKIFTFVASTADPDRHHTVLNQENWELKNFNNNPIIGYQHNLYGDMCNPPDSDDVIGKGLAYMEKGELLVDVIFDDQNEKAVKIESKLERGFLKAVSVGFIELGDGHDGNEDDNEDKDLYYFWGQELVELSVVNIGSNGAALKKSLRSQTFDALRYIYRELDGQFKFSDIEDMKVSDVIDLLEGGKVEKKIDTTYPISEFEYRIILNKQTALTGHKNNS